jgi:antitoxin component YwqK of YwqJK toxin-antitoxin module
VASEADHKNGALHGWTRLYYEDGKVKEERHYVEGDQEGLSRGWYPSGALRYEATYGDVPHPNSLPLLREWNEDGTEKT